MSALGKLKRMLLRQTPQTAGYQPMPWASSIYWNHEERPRFSLFWADQMEFDPQVSFGLAFIDGPLYSAEVEVDGASSDEIGEFVHETWQRIWDRCAEKILRTKIAGYAGFEVMYKLIDGRAEFDDLRDLHPRDTRPLVNGGKLVGVRLIGGRLREPTLRRVSLWGPKGLWLKHNARYGVYYGRSALEYCYAPWFEKYGESGAVKLRQLRMAKDAWRGDHLKFPENKTYPQPDGTMLSARDVAREIADMMRSGGTFQMPSGKTDGNPDWEYVPPTDVTGHTQILEYATDLDLQIWKGLGLPREVVEAAETGSGFSGRQVPLIGFLATRKNELAGYLREIDRQIIRPLVTWNFGVEPEYELRVRPLLETLKAQMASDDEPGGPGVLTSEPQRFGLEDNATGVVDALNNVAASRGVMVPREIKRRISGLLKKNGSLQPPT